MSIFEPIPRESRWEDGGQELNEATSNEEPGPEHGSLDPRSIKIAGLVLASLVVVGLIVSNIAEPEPRPRPPVAAVDPGAAAIEHAEATQSDAPATDQADDNEPAEDDVDTDPPSRGSKWDGDKPGKGHGRGHR